MTTRGEAGGDGLTETEALAAVLVAAMTLCLRSGEGAAAEHVLDAIRALCEDDDETFDGDRRAGFV